MWHDTSVLCGRLAKPERLTSMNLICSWLLTYADRRWHRQPPSAISRGTCSQAWLLSLTPLSRLASSLRPARGLTQGWAMLAGCEVLLKWRCGDHTRHLGTSNQNHQKYNWRCSPFDSVLSQQTRYVRETFRSCLYNVHKFRHSFVCLLDVQYRFNIWMSD